MCHKHPACRARALSRGTGLAEALRMSPSTGERTRITASCATACVGPVLSRIHTASSDTNPANPGRLLAGCIISAGSLAPKPALLAPTRSCVKLSKFEREDCGASQVGRCQNHAYIIYRTPPCSSPGTFCSCRCESSKRFAERSCDGWSRTCSPTGAVAASFFRPCTQTAGVGSLEKRIRAARVLQGRGGLGG